MHHAADEHWQGRFYDLLESHHRRPCILKSDRVDSVA
jgi:hypothetical protein